MASGDREKIRKYWADDMIWLVPDTIRSRAVNAAWMGFALYAGGGAVSGNSFHMDREAIMTSDDASADVTRNVGTGRRRHPEVWIYNVIHYLRWRDGKVIEGRGAIFGDGTAEYDAFWS